jgi:hypothetical protein
VENTDGIMPINLAYDKRTDFVLETDASKMFIVRSYILQLYESDHGKSKICRLT